MRRHGLLTSWWNYDWMQHWDHWTSIVPLSRFLVPVYKTLNLCNTSRFKKCRPLARVITRTHLAITSMFVCMNVSCQFVQHALPNMCSSFCRHADLYLCSIWKLLWSHGQTAWKYFEQLKFIKIGLVSSQNQSHAKVFGTCWDKCVIANLSNANHQVHEVVAPWRVKKTTVTECLMLLEVKHVPCRETSETRVKTAIQAWTSS